MVSRFTTRGGSKMVEKLCNFGGVNGPLLPNKMANTQIRLSQFLGVKFTFLFLIQSFELRFHKLHELLLGDHSFFVSSHKAHLLPDYVLTHRQSVLGLRSGCFLRGGISKQGSGHNQGGDDGDDPEPI